ncbi:MAG: TolC family protein [Candidatus Omnitrophota bacterium]
MKKIYIIYLKSIFLIACFILTAKQSYPEEPQDTLNTFIDKALKNNPSVQSAYNDWKAEEYKIRYVKGLPDPMASYSYFGKNVETRIGPQESKYGLSQKIPFPGKLAIKGKAQSKSADILKEKYEAIKREVIKEVKFVYYDIFWVDKAIAITEEEKAIIESLEKVAQRKFESNLSPQQDVVKAQVEISKLIDELFRLRQNRSSLNSRLNSIINMPDPIEIDKIGDVAISNFDYDLEKLHKTALGSKQELLAANLEIERAKYEKSLAKLGYFPDFTFGVDYTQIGGGHTTQLNDGEDAWMGKVAINVPIWFDKLNADLNEKRSRLEAKKDNFRNIENNIDYEVDDLYFKINTYKDIISLYKTALVPQAEQAFEAARIGYETGKVDFLNWLDAERVILQIRLAFYKSVVDYQKSIAYLERIVGRDL